MQEHFAHQTRSLQWLHTLQEIVLYTMVFSVAFSVLPLTANFFDEIKTALVIVLSALSIGLWALQTVIRKKITLTVHPLIIPLGLYLIALITSGVLSPLPLTESLTGVTGATVALITMSFFTPQLIHKKLSSRFADSILSLGAILTVLSFLQVFGVGPSILLNGLFGLNIPNNFAFSLTGSALVTLTILVVGFISSLGYLLHTRHFNPLRVAGISVVFIGILLHVFMMTTKIEFRPYLLPMGANWVIATDTLKTAPTAFFGFGPNSFSNAYSLFKPVTLNSTRSWNVLFEAGSNTPLTYLVTLGLLGLVAWVSLLLLSLNLLRTSRQEARPAGLIVVMALIVQLFVPINIPLLTIQFVALMFWISSLRETDHARVSEFTLQLNATHSKRPEAAARSFGILSYVAAVVTLGIAALFIWYTQMIMRAEMVFFQSLKAFAENDGEKTYQLQQQVLNINPFNDGYHSAFAQTNFAIAQALSAQEAPTEEQKTMITQLLQQALEQSRIATQINPRSSNNWSLMGSLYSNLIGSIEGADQWALAAYVRAVETDRNNPLLRVQIGNLFYQAENYAQATELYTQAVQLKPDLQSAYFNLGQSLDKSGDTKNAITVYQQLLSLMDPQSNDYMEVEKELNAFLEKAKVEAENQEAVTTETDPQEAPLSEEVRQEGAVIDEQAPPQIDEAEVTPTVAPDLSSEASPTE